MAKTTILQWRKFKRSLQLVNTAVHWLLPSGRSARRDAWTQNIWLFQIRRDAPKNAAFRPGAGSDVKAQAQTRRRRGEKRTMWASLNTHTDTRVYILTRRHENTHVHGGHAHKHPRSCRRTRKQTRTRNYVRKREHAHNRKTRRNVTRCIDETNAGYFRWNDLSLKRCSFEETSCLKRRLTN